MFSVFAAFFLVVWWRDRDAGLDAIGLSALLVAAFYVARNVGLVPPPAALLGPWWLTMLLACANLLLGIGLARYVAGQVAGARGCCGSPRRRSSGWCWPRSLRCPFRDRSATPSWGRRCRCWRG